MGDLNPTESIAGDVNLLETFLANNPPVKYIRFQWVDYSGVLNARVATKSFSLSLGRQGSALTTGSPILTALLLDSTVLMEKVTLEIDEVFADWESLKVCHYAPNHAMVMCFVKEGGAKAFALDGRGLRKCPRYRLREICSLAKEKHDMHFLIGHEIEFFLFSDSNGTPTPLDVAPNTYSAASLNNKYLPVLEEIVDSIQDAGFEVRQFHSEGGPGCFEISIEPLPPLQSADALVYCHEAIRNISSKHGVHGTVFPKPFEKLSVVGSHYHLSMSRLDKQESFLAGLLENWTALAAFYMPNYDSNTRVSPDSRVFWSQQNRTATHRKIKDGYWELRSVDATANPYLAMTAILTAGLIGFEKGKILSMKDPLKFIFKEFPEEEVKQFGVGAKMPTSLKSALECLKAAEELKEALGPELVDDYLTVKNKEIEIFGKMTGSERRDMCMKIF